MTNESDSNKEAWKAYEAREYDLALKLFNKCSMESANSDDKHWALANTAYPLVKLGNFELARKNVRLAWESTNDSHFLHQMAFVERESGNFEVALDLIEKERSLIEADNYHRLGVNSYEQAKLRQLLDKISEAYVWSEICKKESLRTDDWVAKACAYRVMGDQYHLSKQNFNAQVQYLWAQWCFRRGNDVVGETELYELQKKSGILVEDSHYYFHIPDIESSKDFLIKNRADSFLTSFGNEDNFWKEDPNGDKYIGWLIEKLQKFPASLACIYKDDISVGQIELGRYKPDPAIGYVNLFYLVPTMRGIGLGKLLSNYVDLYFKEDNVEKAYLSVSPTNVLALKYYTKFGWKDLGPRPSAPEVHLMEKSFHN